MKKLFSSNKHPLSQHFGKPFREKLHKHRRMLFIAITLLVIYFIWHSHHKPMVVQPAISVVVAKVEKKDIPVYIAALGNVTATNTVTVKTQINGLLMKVLFEEGQMVKKGDLIAEIDQRFLLAELKEYQGQLIRDQALLDNALIDLNRYQTLWKKSAISQQALATQIALVKQYQGTVEMDQGLIQKTKVNLIYCHIISPVDGRIGLRQVDPGNFVQTTDTTGLAVITTLNPITVIFNIPEDNIPDVLPKAYAHKKLLVEAYDRQDNKRLATGILIALDNQINTSTGTVKMRALFDNRDNKLFANQFVNIQILARTLHNAMVIPTTAVQHDMNGDYVYRLNEDNTVTIQPIKTGVTRGDNTVVLHGLLLGHRVVTEGVDRLTNGAKVNIV